MSKVQHNTSDLEGYRRVGKVKDAHALKGELYLLIFSGDSSWVDEVSELTLVSPRGDKQKVLTLVQATDHKEGLIVKTKELLDRNQAEACKGWMVNIPEAALETGDSEDFYLTEIEGFKVLDHNEQLLGHIESFSFNGDHDLIHFQHQGKEVSIPLVEDWIIELNFDTETLQMSLPPGLLEVQLETGSVQDDGASEE